MAIVGVMVWLVSGSVVGEWVIMAVVMERAFGGVGGGLGGS